MLITRTSHCEDKLEQLKYKSDWRRRRASLVGRLTRKINLVSLNVDPALLVRGSIFTCAFEISFVCVPPQMRMLLWQRFENSSDVYMPPRICM